LPLFATQRGRLTADERDAIHDRRLSNHAHGLAHSLRGMGTGAQPPLHAEFARLRTPVWIGHGADDAKFAEIADDLAKRLPRAQRCAIPRAGHAAHLENRNAVAAELERFFARAERTERSPLPTDPLRAAQGDQP
jgi:pimeloyl-ACP methyl ester carboxylesterase